MTAPMILFPELFCRQISIIISLLSVMSTYISMHALLNLIKKKEVRYIYIYISFTTRKIDVDHNYIPVLFLFHTLYLHNLSILPPPNP